MKTNGAAGRLGCSLLVIFVLMAGGWSARAQEHGGPARGGAVISSVAITQAGERASVRVEGEGLQEARAMRMENPNRLVLDFAGTRMAVEKTEIPGVSAPVLGVRLGQYKPTVARVVIDLTTHAEYEVTRDGGGVVILIKGGAALPAAKEDVAAAQTGDSGTQKIPMHFGVAAPRIRASAARRNGKAGRFGAPSLKYALPKELTQPLQALAIPAGKPARPAQEPQPQPQQPAPVVPAAPAAQQAAAPSAPAGTQQAATGPITMASITQGGKYTGEPISVNLKDVDLKDFFRLIHEISGLNVILDPAVKGTLTIVLDEVPWDQALDLVLLNNGLDKQVSGNVLRIATRETFTKEAKVQQEMQKAQQEVVEPVTVTRVLSYAKAKDMEPTLKKFLSARGDIFSDARSNQLIIRDIPSTIPVVDNLLRQLDRKSQQVEIEARVVSASRSFARDLGVQLAFAGTTTNGRNVFGGNQAVGSSTLISPAGVPPPPLTVGGSSSGGGVMPLVYNLAAGAATSGMVFGHRSPNAAVDLFISAAEAKGVGKLLSKPKIITQNNEKATVKQGTKIPVQTMVNNTVAIQLIDAVLKLEVTPQITADGTVYMEVMVENTQIDNGIARVQGVPALDTQSAETKITVPDGQTVVLGGIIVSQQRVDINQVPLLGSMPVIGHLFRRQSVSNSSQELFFFLTPRVIPG
ncbi:MAG: type IV pilus secretin PilQ [Acidobacteriia bacterium]|nr:type IV pilus secretin PilQ [Terriglobia bacterium]